MLNRTKKLISIACSAVLAVSILSGCSNNGSSETTDKNETTAAKADAESTTSKGAENDETKDAEVTAGENANTDLSGEITQWVWGDYEIKGAMDFNQYYPNIKVNYVTIASDEYEQKLQSTAASGAEMPDVVNLEMGPRGMLLNLDIWERLDAAPYNLNPDDLVDFALPLISNQAGEILSVQIDNCVGGFAYNRSLAEEYFGTQDPDEMEEMFSSIDAFVEKGKELADASGGKIVMFSGGGDALNSICALFTDEAWVIDGKLNLKPTLLPALEYIEKMYADGSLGTYEQWTPGWNASFATDDIMFYGAPSWFMTWTMKANDDSTGKWGFISPPGGGFNWGGTAYAIPKAAKEENKPLAWEYIKWFTMSPEGTACFVREQVTPTLYAPAIGTDVYAPNPDPYFGGQDVLSKLLEISENPQTKVRPMTEYDDTIDTTTRSVLLEMANGLSAADAIEKIEDEVVKIIPALSK